MLILPSHCSSVDLKSQTVRQLDYRLKHATCNVRNKRLLYIPGAPKKVNFPKEFSYFFFKNYRAVWHTIVHTGNSFNYPYIRKISLHYLQNWQNYAAFINGNLIISSWDVCKIVSTIQDNADAVSANTFLSRDKCLRVSSVTIHVLLPNYL